MWLAGSTSRKIRSRCIDVPTEGEETVRKSYLVFTIFGCVGLIVTLYFYESANPMAWIDMKLSRSEILEAARSYAEGRGFNRQEPSPDVR